MHAPPHRKSKSNEVAFAFASAQKLSVMNFSRVVFLFAVGLSYHWRINSSVKISKTCVLRRQD